MINKLQTEATNDNTKNLDSASTLEVLDMFYNEDKKVAKAVHDKSEELAKIIDVIAAKYNAGGRIIYIGAGNSGRLAMCDATECSPTFNIEPERVIAIVAGGIKSLYSALESIEDSESQAIIDLEKVNPTPNDVLIGLSASGRTPYVKAALSVYSDMTTVAISCNVGSEVSNIAKYAVEIDVGPEVIAGSTRLKAGTAQKMILNMISSIVMVKQGYVRENKMINVRITNEKLMHRGVEILMHFFEISDVEAIDVLKRNNLNMKEAIEELELELELMLD